MANVQERSEGLDPVRKLVFDRTRELGLSLTDLSRMIERNGTYIHQFLYRRSPKTLPEDAREDIARALKIDPGVLRGEPKRGARLAPPKSPLVSGGLPLSSDSPPAASVPLFNEGDRIDGPPPARATLLLPVGPEAFAIWLFRPHGKRLAAGDIAFACRKEFKAGDPVAVVRDSRIVAIGDLIEADQAKIVVADGETPSKMPTEGASVFRIAYAHFH